MSVKKTSSLGDLYTFKESEKSLKKNPLGFIFTMKSFNESEKSLKETPLEFFMFESRAQKSNKISSNYFSCFNQSMKIKSKINTILLFLTSSKISRKNARRLVSFLHNLKTNG